MAIASGIGGRRLVMYLTAELLQAIDRRHD
jgi:hypothetical protein